MQIELLFLLTALLGSAVYVGYMVKNRGSNPTAKPEQQPQQTQSIQENKTLKELEEKHVKLENELHDLKIAWKLQPKPETNPIEKELKIVPKKEKKQ